MLLPRIIPCLLVHQGGLVKTIGFDNPTYVGDPINAVRIFNEKQVDELVVLDIDATRHGAEPDYARIAHLAAECRMPLCYGGGVRTVEQVERIVALGVEKVAISAAAVEDPSILKKLGEGVGRQSILAVMDVRKQAGGRYTVVTHNATRDSGLQPADLARAWEAAGAGEIAINAVDREGTSQGYDFDLLDTIVPHVGIPVTCLGGAGSPDDLSGLFARYGTIGAAAGTMFVFKGPRRAVLINYPTAQRKAAIQAAATLGGNDHG